MDMKDIFELIEKFDASSLSKIKLSQGDVKLFLQKGYPQAVVATGSYAPAALQAAPAPAPAAAAAPASAAATSPAAAAAPAGDTEIITAPIVGSFYRTPSPDSPAFVEVGSKVKSGETICIIEAMKVMNQLEADFDMEIVKILVENGTMVEYGAPLFEVRRI